MFTNHSLKVCPSGLGNQGRCQVYWPLLTEPYRQETKITHQLQFQQKLLTNKTTSTMNEWFQLPRGISCAKTCAKTCWHWKMTSLLFSQKKYDRLKWKKCLEGTSSILGVTTADLTHRFNALLTQEIRFYDLIFRFRMNEMRPINFLETFLYFKSILWCSKIFQILKQNYGNRRGNNYLLFHLKVDINNLKEIFLKNVQFLTRFQ